MSITRSATVEATSPTSNEDDARRCRKRDPTCVANYLVSEIHNPENHDLENYDLENY